MDRTGFGHHADYVFGWKGDALQNAMDARCDVYDASPDPLVFPASGCPQLKSQDQFIANQCSQKQIAQEDIDDCKLKLEYHNSSCERGQC